METITGGGAFTRKNIDDINSNFADLSASTAGGTLTAAHILVGSAGNVATDVAMSGAIAIDDTGATSIADLGDATGTSVTLSGDCKAATFHAGSTAGVTAGPFTTVASIATTAGLVTTLTGS